MPPARPGLPHRFSLWYTGGVNDRGFFTVFKQYPRLQDWVSQYPPGSPGAGSAARVRCAKSVGAQGLGFSSLVIVSTAPRCFPNKSLHISVVPHSLSSPNGQWCQGKLSPNASPVQTSGSPTATLQHPWDGRKLHGRLGQSSGFIIWWNTKEKTLSETQNKRFKRVREWNTWVPRETAPQLKTLTTQVRGPMFGSPETE